MTVRFRLLGVIEASVDGELIHLGYAQLRSMLAVLLVEANHPVSVDQLIDRVWAARRLPHQPRRAVQHNMVLLRRALAAATGVTISRLGAGYQLTADPDTIDLHRFHGLLDRARTAPDAEALFEQALALWRGEPFADVDTPWLDALRTILTARHQAARLDLTDIQLRHGRHATLLADLAQQTEEHPLDERLAGQYLLALYRSGRPAKALAHYRRISRLLADELGTDPSRPLQQLHLRILAADPTLSEPGTARVPRQLPAPPRLFTGRATELAELDRTPLVAVSGPGGVGKTALVLQWAHHHIDRFPDGQLHVDLRGFDPSGHPTPISEAIRGFLDGLGIDAATLPPEPDSQAARYRSLVSGKRMLILLDNAADLDQVIPLLPGSGTCTVLITSRRHLTGLAALHGAHLLDLNVLPEPDAHELLASHLGPDRAAAEPHAVADLLAVCAGLPLAVRIVAARAQQHPGFPLAALADELRDASGRLDGLDAGDVRVNLRGVLSWSVHSLDAEAAWLFGLLGIAPGPGISLTAVASLAGQPVERVRAVLRELEHASLVAQHEPGRYRMHDLIRLCAAETSVAKLASIAGSVAALP